MSTDLFRNEVLDANGNRWLGTISLAQPIRIWVMTSVAVSAAICIVLFLTLATHTRRHSVAGQLVPSKGMATVLSPATGVVSRLNIVEGESAKEGQVLAVITIPRSTMGGANTQAALEDQLRRQVDSLQLAHNARQQLLANQRKGTLRQLAQARNEVDQVVAEIATRKRQVAISHETLDRMKQLEASSYVSVLQIRQQESNMLELTGQVQALQRQDSVLRRQVTQLEQMVSALPGESRISNGNYQRDRSVLEREYLELESRGSLSVTAPVGGVVATQLVKAGQAVQVNQSILSIVPGDGELEAELMVPSRSIGFVRVGDAVLLRYQAYPYQKFGHHLGEVTRVSRSTVVPPDDVNTKRGIQPSEPLYRVSVAIARQSINAYSREEPLKPGMLLEADVLGERRRLVEWLFEPLYSIGGRVAGG